MSVRVESCFFLGIASLGGSETGTVEAIASSGFCFWHMRYDVHGWRSLQRRRRGGEHTYQSKSNLGRVHCLRDARIKKLAEKACSWVFRY